MSSTKVIPILIFLVGALTACGGGGGQPASNNTSNATVNTVDVNIDIGGGEYSLVTEKTAEVVLDGSNVTIDAPMNEKELVMMADKTGEPILLALKHSGDDAVEVSVESSAEVFVLMNPRFFGVEFTDMKELSTRIRSHTEFPFLVTELKNQIESNSPCPMDPNCSFVASISADTIAVETIITDLVE